MKPDQHARLLGVELAADRISAVVFHAQGRIVGKAATGTKMERGASAMLDRVARCALDAVDEADLTPADIAAAGFVLKDDGGVLGGLIKGRPHSTVSPLTVELGRRLPPNLARRLVTADYFNTVVWAAQERQFAGASGRLLAWFAGPVPVARLYDYAGIHDVPLPKAPGNDDEPAGAALANALLELVPATRADSVLLVGGIFAEDGAQEIRTVRAQLREAGHDVTVRVPETGARVGPWAAACLAGKTFATDGE
jgi:hypothetical protein